MADAETPKGGPRRNDGPLGEKEHILNQDPERFYEELGSYNGPDLERVSSLDWQAQVSKEEANLEIQLQHLNDHQDVLLVEILHRISDFLDDIQQDLDGRQHYSKNRGNVQRDAKGRPDEQVSHGQSQLLTAVEPTATIANPIAANIGGETLTQTWN